MTVSVTAVSTKWHTDISYTTVFQPHDLYLVSTLCVCVCVYVEREREKERERTRRELI